MINRLEGLAIFLLGDELAEIADRARAAARRLADRIGDLGGAITADPRQLLDRSPGTEEFTLPDCSDVASIGDHGLQRLNIIIAAYEAFWIKSAAPTTSASTSCWTCSPPKPTSAPTSKPHTRGAVDPTRTTVTGSPEGRRTVRMMRAVHATCAGQRCHCLDTVPAQAPVSLTRRPASADDVLGDRALLGLHRG